MPIIATSADVRHIDFKEGLHLVFPPDADVSIRRLLALTWTASVRLRQPARCVGLLPGLMLQVSSHTPIAELPMVMAPACLRALAQLEAWLDAPTAPPLLRLDLPQTHAVVTQDSIRQLLPPAVVLERQHWRSAVAGGASWQEAA